MMLNMLSTGKDIQLNEVPSLQSTYSLKYSLDPRKIFIFPQENFFVSLYRDTRIDLLQAYEGSNGTNKIKRIKKLRLDGVTCGNVMSKDGKYEIALGLSNGNIEFVDFKTNKMLEKKIPCDVFGNGVVDMDFNRDYDILAGTFDSGALQLFGTKKFQKLQRYKLDMKSDLIRFHPSNPHLLAITSLSGGLTILNINIKKTMYSNPSAHKHYSKNICWLPSAPSTLISVGGSTLKVFDIRQNATLSVTEHVYPYSALAVSSCGNYCCAGDMKGSIISYDYRNIRTALHTNNCHEGSVNNLCFLPCSLNGELTDEEHESDVDSAFDSVEPKARRKSSSRRTSAQDFFDQVMPQIVPVKQQNNSRRSMDEFLELVSSPIVSEMESTKAVSNNLESVAEEGMTDESINSNNQVSMDIESTEISANLKNKCLTHPSQIQDFDNRSANRHTITYSPISNNNLNEVQSAKQSSHSISHQTTSSHQNKGSYMSTSGLNNAAFMSQMTEMTEKIQNLETRLDTTMYNVNTKMMDIERKLESKIDDLSNQIQHGFLSIHSNLWAVAESDIREIKTMVSTIHENYSKIEDVFIENVLLKEQLHELKNKSDSEDI